MTSCGLETSFQFKTSLEDGLTYYIAIKATNGAGLSTIAYSDGITIDTSPPLVGPVVHGAPVDSDMDESVTSISYAKDNSTYYQVMILQMAGSGEQV